MKKFIAIVVSSVYLILTMCNIRPYALEVSAKACVMLEATSGNVIYSKNPDEVLPMASTTKIMTTLLCLESGDLDTPFVVDSEAIKVEGSSMGLVEGDIVTKRALCYGMLLPSGNDSANATAVKVAGSIECFAELMNDRAKSIGMKNTLFVTPSGLDEGGHSSTAYDMAILTKEALKNPDFREICRQSSAQVHFGNPPYDRWLKNSNKLLNMYDGVIGVKTGFTDDAGRCLVSACERNGVTLIVVTLNAPNDWNDHMSLYDYGFSKVSSQTVSDTFSINVVGGTTDSVSLQCKESISIPNIDGSNVEYSVTTHTANFVYAPIECGEVLGYAEYRIDGQVVATSDLVACQNVSKDTTTVELSIKDRLFKWLYSI